MEVARPRVAAIGLDDSQADSIRPLCGTLRRAPTLGAYLVHFDWTETDILIANRALRSGEYVGPVHLLTVGLAHFALSREPGSLRSIDTNSGNTEREVRVPHGCPPQYEALAAGLSLDLARGANPATRLLRSSRRQRPRHEIDRDYVRSTCSLATQPRASPSKTRSFGAKDSCARSAGSPQSRVLVSRFPLSHQ